jgi:hypothetical protein
MSRARPAACKSFGVPGFCGEIGWSGAMRLANAFWIFASVKSSIQTRITGAWHPHA